MNKVSTMNFKKTLIIFWAIWWTIAFWTDISGGLKHLGILHASWIFDGNYPFLTKSLALYSMPQWFVTFLYLGIIFWSLLSAGWFWYASLAINNAKALWMRRAHQAFIISMTFWLVFFLADQMIMNFDLEQNHMVQGGFELLSWMAIALL